MEDSERKKKSGLSESFIVGVIAIVFLVVGYQTALFIHQAAVMKIAANRDNPDTVYVYVSSPEAGSVSADPPVQKAVRKNAEHSPRAEVVRQNMPRRNAETFRFNPNTVSVEDLCRLGFSLKQAQSIDNYRNKGGRFNRKADFAKSYVVAETVYRRLEPFIDIPLVDLNLADSAAFDSLPGIGGWFASKMVEHRSALGGYSYKEQLMDIYRFDQEKYDALSDLITVSEDHVIPYPLWSLLADSLCKHPYINNLEVARAVVLYRETTPSDQWSIDGLRKAGILSEENAEKLKRCNIK
ncbi:MAG: helix-hairpin-helix domain-containing protein [Bacteroidales bacterium]|nr:helix-hairpin-helix domain-containing protein [Bacteroidales bacterium]